jgi:predicted DsbA family dithiol-disulfide isomerase
VAKLQNKFDIKVVFRHFPLHPKTPEAGLTLEKLFAGRNLDIPAIQSRMTHLMAEEGLAYGERTKTFNSRLAQELAMWAETQPRGQQIHDALFQAYFVNEINLAKTDNLIVIAEKIGLESSDAEKVLEERQYRESVDADWQRSRELGVTSVPTFVVGNRGLVGAQPYEQLEAFLITEGAQLREN